MQYLFVNGRCIRDRGLGHAVQEAYRGLIMTGRYPVVFLFLDLPPDLVDVNVHPTKAEVRFREGNLLHNLLHSAIRNRLHAENLTARLRAPAPLATPATLGGAATTGDEWFRVRPIVQTPLLSFGSPPQASSPSAPPAREPAPAAAPTFPPPADVMAAVQETSRPPTSAGDPLPPKAIQLYNAYLVLETPEGMLVIDQHALHERILFEQLKSRIRTGTLETQKLLIPEPVELTAEQAARTLEHQADLAHLGIGVEDFGGGTLLLTGYPALLGNRSPQAILKAVVDHLASKERVPTREQFLNNILSLMACHAAVRAGDPLSPEEIAALIAQRNLADDAHHCPHGRPTALLFSRQELDRQFRRT
jgi:DNA mismatch repair protein MutL